MNAAQPLMDNFLGGMTMNTAPTQSSAGVCPTCNRQMQQAPPQNNGGQPDRDILGGIEGLVEEILPVVELALLL